MCSWSHWNVLSCEKENFFSFLSQERHPLSIARAVAVSLNTAKKEFLFDNDTVVSSKFHSSTATAAAIFGETISSVSHALKCWVQLYEWERKDSTDTRKKAEIDRWSGGWKRKYYYYYYCRKRKKKNGEDGKRERIDRWNTKRKEKKRSKREKERKRPCIRLEKKNRRWKHETEKQNPAGMRKGSERGGWHGRGRTDMVKRREIYRWNDYQKRNVPLKRYKGEYSTTVETASGRIIPLIRHDKSTVETAIGRRNTADKLQRREM